MTHTTLPDTVFSRRLLSADWERTLTVLGAVMIILLTTHSFQFLFADTVTEGMSDRATARSNPLYLAWFAVQLGTFLLLFVYTILARGMGGDLLVGLAVFLFVALSSIWSVNAKTTLMHAAVLFYLIAAAYVCAVHLRPSEFIRVYFWVSVIILVSSLVLRVAMPDLTGQLRYGGGWFGERQFHGVMSSKNLAGFIFASTFVIAWNGSLAGIGLIWRILFGALALVAVALTDSATAVLVIVILTPVSIVLRLAGRYQQILTFFTLSGLLAAILAIPFVSFGASLGVLGRDATFTGRTQLWRLGLENIAERPVFGHGYLGFFDAGAFSPAWKFWESFVYFLTDTFHNTSVDVMISLGLVGLLILCALCLTAAGIVFNRTLGEDERLITALLVAVFLIGGTMEFTILHHNYVATVVVFFAAFSALRKRSDVFAPQAPTQKPPAETGRRLLI